VTTNYVDADYGVFNDAPTFITLAENARRPHDVQIELPPGWTAAMTGLDGAPGGRPNQFRAADYETLVDSPIVAGKLGIRTFDVAGKKHFVVSAGEPGSIVGWDGPATRDLQTFVEESHRFWGFLPYGNTCSCCCFGPVAVGSNIATRISRRCWRGLDRVPMASPPRRCSWPASGSRRTSTPSVQREAAPPGRARSLQLPRRRQPRAACGSLKA
jgi:hypothetical protein